MSTQAEDDSRAGDFREHPAYPKLVRGSRLWAVGLVIGAISFVTMPVVANFTGGQWFLLGGLGFIPAQILVIVGTLRETSAGRALAADLGREELSGVVRAARRDVFTRALRLPGGGRPGGPGVR